MALDAVPGSPTANSYITVEQATALLQERLHIEAWYTPDPAGAVTLPARREAALIWATRLLDEQIGWHGAPATDTQVLAWPQAGQVDHLGRPIDPAIIPRAVQQATAFYALALLRDTAAVGAAEGDAGIKSKTIGDTSITYKDTAAVPLSYLNVVPYEVRSLLRDYGMVPGGGNIPVFRT